MFLPSMHKVSSKFSLAPRAGENDIKQLKSLDHPNSIGTRIIASRMDESLFNNSPSNS